MQKDIVSQLTVVILLAFKTRNNSNFYLTPCRKTARDARYTAFGSAEMIMEIQQIGLGQISHRLPFIRR